MLILFLVAVSFLLFILSFVFILLDVLKAKKQSKTGYKKEGLSKLSAYSYGCGIIAMLMLMFVGGMLAT